MTEIGHRLAPYDTLLFQYRQVLGYTYLRQLELFVSSFT